jgi:hypothetical protein
VSHFVKFLLVLSCLIAANSLVVAQDMDAGARLRTFGSVVQLRVNSDEIGTGFSVDDAGIIITNAHVIENIDIENPDIVVGIFESNSAPATDLYLARPVVSRGEPMIYPEIDIALLEIYATLDGVEVKEGDLSLTPISYWQSDLANIADPLYVFGYPDISENWPYAATGTITRIISPSNYASDVVFGQAGSGGPALSNNSTVIGVASASSSNQSDDYTLVISLSLICGEYPEVCKLLPSQDVDPSDGPPARRVNPGGYLQCLNARGPSFELGDRFAVPTGGSGGTYIRSTPSWIMNNRTVLVDEGEGGTIIQGPVCGPAAKGELIGWFVETDDGETGWISEGYIFNVRPWIVPEAQVDNWIDYVPEDFVCPASYGPNFQVGDRFIIPVGDGGTTMWANPNRAPEAGQIPEGETGIILEGPECARGNGGLLVSWRVLSDGGLSGWVSEGYDDSPLPWISPIVDN